MTMQRKFVSGAVMAAEGLGPRQIRVRASDATKDRAGDILIPGGCMVQSADKSVPVLVDHEATVKSLIGTAKISITEQAVEALITFFDEGLDDTADMACAKAKAGGLNSVSVGFNPVSVTPIKGGYQYDQWDLMELSMVVVPCNPNATVMERSFPAKSATENWKCGASKTLPLGNDDAWDGAAAEASIWEWAGGDDFDSAKAKKAFLAYDAANPSLKGSYKLPFAKVVDGRLTAMPAGVRAAASRLPQSDIPDAVAEKARGVLDTYEAKMSDDKGAPARVTKTGKPAVTKGLYQCAQLAGLLSDLSWLEECVEWEAEYEGDGSPLPQMLADIMRAMGDALLAMTAEEVAELLGEDGGEAQKSFGPRVVKSLTALRAKAGRTISAATRDQMQAAMDAHEQAMDHHKAAIKAHKDGMAIVKGLMETSDSDGADNAGTETQSGGDVSTDGNTSEKSIPRGEHYRRKVALARISV